MRMKKRIESPAQSVITGMPQVKSKAYWIETASASSNASDSSHLGKDSTNINTVMRTRWNKVVSANSKLNKSKYSKSEATEAAIRTIHTISSITPASRGPTKPAAVRNHHPRKISSAPRRR